MASNPYAGETGNELDCGELEYQWDGKDEGVAFEVAAYDLGDGAYCVVVELDDGSDDDPIYETLFFEADRRGYGSYEIDGIHVTDDALRIPWSWLPEDCQEACWDTATSWWENGGQDAWRAARADEEPERRPGLLARLLGAR